MLALGVGKGQENVYLGHFENVYINKKQKSWIFNFSEIVPKFYKSICSIDLSKDIYTNLSNFATTI